MLKKGLCIFLSLILVIYLILVLLVSTNYQKVPSGFSYVFRRQVSTNFIMEAMGHINEGDVIESPTISFVDSLRSDINYRIEFTVPTSFVMESIDLDTFVYVSKANVSHLAINTEIYEDAFTEPFFPIYSLYGKFSYYVNSENPTLNTIQFECISFEIHLNTETILGIVGNNLATASRDFDYGDISNVGDLLGWFNNFIRSIFNFTRNIISDFQGVF